MDVIVWLVLQVSKWYELVVFTASMEIYGTAVADRLDAGSGILKRRYYRQHCTLDFGSYTKDLSAINDDLSSVFILDNSPGAYRAYPGIHYYHHRRAAIYFSLSTGFELNLNLLYSFFFRQCNTDQVLVQRPV